jgi:hypothetical protein
VLVVGDKLRLTKTKIDELSKRVKTTLIEQSESFDNSAKDRYIAFNGWTLDVTKNNFEKPRKELNVIDGFEFSPDGANTVPETWVSYADYMFGQNARYVWAWLGYAFQSNMNWRQGALFLLDPIGGTGKTYFITQITQAMFGEERVGAFKLKNLQGNNARFETARFIGKSVMIDDDATRVRFKEDDTFKSVTGGGLSPVERKGIDGTDYKITAKMIINVNEMPVFNNAGAIKRRLHIVKVEAPVATSREIEQRNVLFPPEDLQAEIPSLATYAIEQYQQAVKEDWQIIDNIADDIVATDPFVIWLETLEKGTFKSNDLYQNYVTSFIITMGEEEKPMTLNGWGRKMVNYFKKIQKREGAYYVIK